jgi:very-short-patch-repair endonuclease
MFGQCHRQVSESEKELRTYFVREVQSWSQLTQEKVVVLFAQKITHFSSVILTFRLANCKRVMYYLDMLVQCHICKKLVMLEKQALARFRRSGRAYCSVACINAYKAIISGPLLASWNRQHAAQRMREKNPMFNDAHREKMRQTLLAQKHQPKVRGGNGCGLTRPQAQLLAALKPPWQPEVVIPTGQRAVGGLPTHFKIDIAHAAAQIAIEIDGHSHAVRARQDADRRKTRYLESIGWQVFRFSNKEVLDQTQQIVEQMSSILKSKIITTIS